MLSFKTPNKLLSMKKIALLLFFSLFLFSLQAQKGLKGHWEGTISFGGHEKKDGVRFELYIEVIGKRVKGETFIYKSKTEIIAQKFTGRIFNDHSISMQESFSTKPSPLSDNEKPKKYQFIYNRSIFDSSLEGWWQDIIKNPFDETRERGRVYMRKTKVTKA